MPYMPGTHGWKGYQAARASSEKCNTPYEERLRILSIYSAEYRRLRGALLQLYTITRHPEHPCHSLLDFRNTRCLRGNQQKLFQLLAVLNCRHTFLLMEAIRTWNNLPDYIISSASTEEFKKNFDDHMGNTVFQITWTFSMHHRVLRHTRPHFFSSVGHVKLCF